MLDIIGWLGAGLLLLGFVLNIFKIIHVDSVSYLVLNLLGSLMLLYVAYMNSAYPFVTVNAVWGAFSAFKLVNRKK